MLASAVFAATFLLAYLADIELEGSTSTVPREIDADKKHPSPLAKHHK